MNNTITICIYFISIIRNILQSRCSRQILILLWSHLRCFVWVVNFWIFTFTVCSGLLLFCVAIVFSFLFTFPCFSRHYISSCLSFVRQINLFFWNMHGVKIDGASTQGARSWKVCLWLDVDAHRDEMLKSKRLKSYVFLWACIMALFIKMVQSLPESNGLKYSLFVCKGLVTINIYRLYAIELQNKYTIFVHEHFKNIFGSYYINKQSQ